VRGRAFGSNDVGHQQKLKTEKSNVQLEKSPLEL
jgi:hypothetical protein